MTDAADRAPVARGDRAYELIRDELLETGAVAGRRRLVERELAEELEMSRTPVREALRRLAHDGLIEIGATGAYVPRRASLRDIQECFELRVLFEPFAAELAARRPHDDVAPFLASASSLAESVGRANAGFHAAVAEASGNLVLAQLIAAVNDRVARQGIHPRLDDGTRSRFAADHHAVVAAIAGGDPEAAAEAMRHHLRLVQTLVEAEISSRRAGRG
jgi:DNA-binding GntR family transcriptional regulator